MTIKVVHKNKRGCGFRKEGGIYLTGNCITMNCDRLPMRIPQCGCCGNTVEFFRGIKQFNPKTFLCECKEGHTCHPTNCEICNNLPEKAYIMWVGAKYYTMDEFKEEAKRLGVSKRIPFVPDGMVRGDKVYLAYPKVFKTKESDDKHKSWKPGIFMMFTVTDIEKIIPATKRNNKQYIEEIEAKGLTPTIEDDSSQLDKFCDIGFGNEIPRCNIDGSLEQPVCDEEIVEKPLEEIYDEPVDYNECDLEKPEFDDNDNEFESPV